jgi:hypothetical protein
MCRVCFDFDSNQLGTKAPLDFFCCAKNIKKEIEGLMFVFEGPNQGK